MSCLVKRALSVVQNTCRFCRTFSSSNDLSALALAKERCPRCQSTAQSGVDPSALMPTRSNEAQPNSPVNFNTSSLSQLTRFSVAQRPFTIQPNRIQLTSVNSASHIAPKQNDRAVPVPSSLQSAESASSALSEINAQKFKARVAAEETFYRRELPRTCVSFSSNEGKRIFAEALQLGYMEAFFTLAPQLTTQDEPAFCGLASLVVALNALQIDPGRVWKGRWRWYHETMLDCCVPLGRVVHNGITLREFASIAECNAVQARTRLADASLGIEELRATIRDCTSRSDRVLVCAYARSRVQQTGEGHFAPIGGFHPERDLVLVLDTARFKYPPHWLPVSLLLDAMRAPDPDAGGRPRGFCVLEKHTALVSEEGAKNSQQQDRVSRSTELLSRCRARTREVRKCSTCGYSESDVD